MSKFFQQGNSSSSESDDDSVKNQQEVASNQNKKIRDKMFQHDDQDHQDDKKRQVVSEKDKQFAKMKEIIKKIGEKLKINDFDAVYNLFEELNRDIEKAKRVISTAGIPNFYLRIIIGLENFLVNFPAEQKQKISTNNSKALNKLKHHMQKNNANYVKEIEAFKANPVETTESEEQEDQESVKSKSDNDSLDEENKSGDSSDSDEDTDPHLDPRRSNDPMIRRRYWLKKYDEKINEKIKIDKKKKDDKEQKDGLQSGSDDEDKITTKKPKEPKIYVIQENKPDRQIDFSIEGVKTKLKDIAENRTKKITRDEYEILSEYYKWLSASYHESDKDQRIVELVYFLISFRSDFGKIISPFYMPRNLWNESLENYRDIFARSKSKNLQLESYNAEKPFEENQLNDFYCICICSLFQDLKKAFNYVDQRSIDYCLRISDMYELLGSAQELSEHFEATNNPQNDHNITQLALRRLEFTYYLHDNVLNELRINSDENFKQVVEKAFPSGQNSEQEIHKLATRIYPNDEANRFRVELYHIYHHAIHNRLSIARDYLLMSKMADQILTRDVHEQILYNRVLVQMGMASFRQGNILDTNQFLSEVCQASRNINKEPINPSLLGQQSKNTDDDKQRTLPYHQHINLELVDTVYLISAMLIEIPNIVQETKVNMYKAISKIFRKICENYDKSQFNGPPDTYKDYIYAASKELKRGDWKNCFRLMNDIPIINRYNYREILKQHIEIRVKEAAFKSYIFAFKTIYDSLSIDELAIKFELESSTIKSILYKMIYNQEIIASINKREQNDFIVFEQIFTTKLQHLASNLLERVTQTLVNNEKISDAQVGNYGFASQEKDQDNNKQSESNNVKGQQGFKTNFNNRDSKQKSKRKNNY